MIIIFGCELTLILKLAAVNIYNLVRVYACLEKA